ncbi:hypothetical protein [Nonomuraea deserti]|nr:hypothetical protein [Nonomuraea deserti]
MNRQRTPSTTLARSGPVLSRARGARELPTPGVRVRAFRAREHTP